VERCVASGVQEFKEFRSSGVQEFKEFKEFKERSQEPESRRR
jgi:hypothetical protein